MRKFIETPAILYSLSILCLCSLFFSCKKSGAGNNSMSFTYNGTPYTISTPQFDADGNRLLIISPGILKGTVFFKPSCGYFAPSDSANNIFMSNDGCQITSNFAPVDSSVIYLFQSGTLNEEKKNCREETGTDLFTGRPMSTTYCDISGTFDIVLKNNGNKTITLKDGKFVIFNR